MTKKPWEYGLHAAVLAVGGIASWQPGTGALTVCCPKCPSPKALEVTEGMLNCPHCDFAAEGGPAELARAMAAAVPAAAAPAETEQVSPLPMLVWGKDIQARVIVLPEELIGGVLHRGGKMVLGGGSKSFKTWCLADLAICIASGRRWWGRQTKQGRVIYLNLEVQSEFFETRIKDICQHKGCSVPEDLGVWNLRGHCTDHTVLLPQLSEKLADMQVAAIILDPTYKVMAKSENAQEEVAALMNSIERLGKATGAAVIFGSHFAKGNASGKEAIDRISGSGVFARDPDAILTMTRHEEEDVFVIEPILRNCPPIPPFCVRWEWPLMTPAEGYDATALRQPAVPGRKKKPIAVDEVVTVLRDMGGRARGAHRTPGSLAKRVAAELDCGRVSAEAAIEAAIRAGEVEGAMVNEGRQYTKFYQLKPSQKP